MGYSKNDFRNDLMDCIKIVERELSLRRSGVSGESTSRQLQEVILPELNELVDKIDKDEELPPKEKRFLISFAYAFKDWGWNMQQPTDLYVKLTLLDNEYRRIL